MMTSLKAIFGLDSGPFRAELGKIDKSLDRFTGKLAKLGLGAIGFTFIQQTFSGIVQHARELEGELDANERAAKNFAGTLDTIKRTMLDIGVAALGTLNRFGEWVGKQVAILQYGREQVELAEQIATEAERNIAAIEQARMAEEEKAKVKAEIAKLDQRVADDLFKQLPLADQRNALERRYLDLVLEATNAGTRTLAGLEKLKASKEVWLELQTTDAALEKQRAAEAEKSRVALERLAAEKERSLDAEARKNIEIARLLLRGVENLSDAEKVQLDILTGRVTQRQAEAELAALLVRGVDQLNAAEKRRLAALAGVESIQRDIEDSLNNQTVAMQRHRELATEMRRQRSDYLAASLDDLRAGNRGTSSQQVTARRIADLEDRARRLIDSGNTVSIVDPRTNRTREVGADYYLNSALEARKQLSTLRSSDREPFSQMNESLKKSEAHLLEIRKNLEPVQVS